MHRKVINIDACVELTPKLMIIISRPGSNQITFSLGTCFPQSCSPERIQELILDAIPKDYKDKISVSITEKSCQIEERPSKLRTIDWITMYVKKK